MERIQLHITDEQNERLRKLVEISGFNRAEHIRRAINQYLDEEEEKYKPVKKVKQKQ